MPDPVPTPTPQPTPPAPNAPVAPPQEGVLLSAPPSAPVQPLTTGQEPGAKSPEPGAKSQTPPTVEQMREALKEIYDPEIPINIVDLGLIYRTEIQEGKAFVELTLTSPHCPLGGMFQEQVEAAIKAMPGVQAVTVALVFEPPWTKDMMTSDGKLQASMLGFM